MVVKGVCVCGEKNTTSEWVSVLHVCPIKKKKKKKKEKGAHDKIK